MALPPSPSRVASTQHFSLVWPCWPDISWLSLAAVNQTADKAYYLFDGYAHFASVLACGLAGLGAGMAIGIVGDAGVRCVTCLGCGAATAFFIASLCRRPAAPPLAIILTLGAALQGKCPATHAVRG